MAGEGEENLAVQGSEAPQIQDGRFGGQRLIGRLPSVYHVEIADGEVVPLAIPERNLRYFAKSGGQRVEPRSLTWK